MSRPPTHRTMMTTTQELVSPRTIPSTTTRTATARNRRCDDKSCIDDISQRFFVGTRSRTNAPKKSTTTTVLSSNKKKQALLLAFLITIRSITAIVAHGADDQQQGKQKDPLTPPAALSNVPHQHDYHEQEGADHHDQIFVNNEDVENDEENSNYSSAYHYDAYGDVLLSDSTIDVASISSSGIADDLVPNGRTMKYPPLFLFSSKQRKTQQSSPINSFEKNGQFYGLEAKYESACPFHHLIISPEECVKAAKIVAKNELDLNSPDRAWGYLTQSDSVRTSSSGGPKLVGRYEFMPPGCSIKTDGAIVFNKFGKHSTTLAKNVGDNYPICTYFGQNYQNDNFNILPKEKSRKCEPHLRITSEDECRIAGTQMGGRYVNRIFVKSNWWRPPGCSLLYYKKTTSVIIYNLYDPNSARDEHSIHYELCRKDPLFNKNYYGLIQDQKRSGGKCAEGTHVKNVKECEQIVLPLLGFLKVERDPIVSETLPFGCFLYHEDGRLNLGYNAGSKGRNTGSIYSSICKHSDKLFNSIYQMLPPDANSVCPSTLPAISQWNCPRAGLSLGGFLPAGSIIVGFWNHAPPGCFISTGYPNIHYNINPNPTGRWSGHYHPLCYSSMTQYPTNSNYQLLIRHKLAECSMGSAITENECKNAGTGLGGRGYKVGEWGGILVPSGCSMRYSDKKIFFNRRMIQSTSNNGQFLPICNYGKNIFEALPKGYSMKCEQGRDLFEWHCSQAGQFLTGNKDHGGVNYLGEKDLAYAPPGCSFSQTRSGIDVVYNTHQNVFTLQNPTNNGNYYPICDGRKYELGLNAVYDYPNPLHLGRTVRNFDPLSDYTEKYMCGKIGGLLGGRTDSFGWPIMVIPGWWEGELPPFGCSIGVDDNWVYYNTYRTGNNGKYYPVLLRKTYKHYQKLKAESGSKCDDGMGVSLVDCQAAIFAMTNDNPIDFFADNPVQAKWDAYSPPGCHMSGGRIDNSGYNINPNGVNSGDWQALCEYDPNTDAQISTACSTLGFDGMCFSLQGKVLEGLHAMFCNKGDTSGCTIYQSILQPLIQIVQMYQDLPELTGCIGDFKGIEMAEDSTADSLGCSNFPVVDDTQYGVIATEMTITTLMQLSLQSVGLWNIPDETVKPNFCLMIKNPSCTRDKNGVQGELGSGFTVGLSFNADTLVTLTNIVPAGEPTADYFIALVGKAIDAGLDHVTFALSAGSGLEDSVDIYVPEADSIRTITYSPNLYIQLAFTNIEVPFLSEKIQGSDFTDFITTTTTVTQAIAFNNLSPGDVMGFFSDPIGTAKDAGSEIQAVFQIDGELQLNLSYISAGILLDLSLVEAYGRIYVAGGDYDDENGNKIEAGCYLTIKLKAVKNVKNILSSMRKKFGGVSGLFGVDPANILLDPILDLISIDLPAKFRLWITKSETYGLQLKILDKEMFICRGQGFINPKVTCKFRGLDPFEMLKDGMKFVLSKLDDVDQIGIIGELASLNDATFGKLGIDISFIPPHVTFPGFTPMVIDAGVFLNNVALENFNKVAGAIIGFLPPIDIPKIIPFKRRRRRFLLERTNIREEDFWSKDEIHPCLQKPYQFGIHATTTAAHMFVLAFPVLDPVANGEEGDESAGSISCPTIASDFLHNRNSELDDVMLSIVHEEEFISEKVLSFENLIMTLNDFAKAIDSAANKLVNSIDDYHVIHNNCGEFVLNVLDNLKMDYMNEEEVYHRILDYVSSQLASDKVWVGTVRFELLKLVQREEEQESRRRTLSSLPGEGADVAVVDTHSPIKRLLRGGNDEAIIHHAVKSYIDSHHEKKSMK